MKMTSKKALDKLKEEKRKSANAYWVDHSICVGYVAGKIAEALNLDIDYKALYVENFNFHESLALCI